MDTALLSYSYHSHIFTDSHTPINRCPLQPIALFLGFLLIKKKLVIKGL